MAQPSEKIESATAALGGTDKDDGKDKVASLLKQLDHESGRNMDDDLDDKDELQDEGLLSTEIAEEIEKSLDESQRTILRQVKQLQIQHFFINKNYEQELQEIKFKYEKLYKPLYDRRRELLFSGLPSITLQENLQQQSGTPYLPGYWLSCLKRHRSLDELIEDQDEAILEYLVDVRCEYIYKDPGQEEYRAIEDIPEESTAAAEARSPSVPASAYEFDESTIDKNILSKSLNEKKTLQLLSSSSTASSYESFRLIFQFADNPFFSPNQLVKEYHLSPQDAVKKDEEKKKEEEKKEGDSAEKKDEEKTLLSEASCLGKLLSKNSTDDELNKNLLILSDGNTAELEGTVSTIINWKEGKDPTKKIVIKKQRNRRTKQTRTVQETVINDSFFNFFSNHKLPGQEELDKMTQRQAAELQMVVEADYDIGVVIRDRIIPESVTWFLGLAMESDEEIEDDEDENDEDDEDYDSDLSSEEDAKGKGGKGKGNY